MLTGLALALWLLAKSIAGIALATVFVVGCVRG